jgi:hypothetical protein
MKEAAPKCPKCGMELPEMLLNAHVESCTEEGTVDTVPADAPQDISLPPFMTGPSDNEDLFDDLLGGTMEEREDSGGVMEPDLDDEFNRLVKQIDLSEIGPMVPDVVVTTLDDAELSSHYSQVREELLQRGEMINPGTQTGRDLHSQRAAYIIELRRRGLVE